jgi:hypothetical protein
MKKLDEQNMSALEELIPFLAGDAVKKARIRTLQSGRNVVEAVDSKLVESHPDGTFTVLKSLVPPIPVTPGQKLFRRRSV